MNKSRGLPGSPHCWTTVFLLYHDNDKPNTDISGGRGGSRATGGSPTCLGRVQGRVVEATFGWELLLRGKVFPLHFSTNARPDVGSVMANWNSNRHRVLSHKPFYYRALGPTKQDNNSEETHAQPSGFVNHSSTATNQYWIEKP